MTAWEAYLYATGVVLGSGLYIITHHPYFFECCHAGMHLRIASCSIVYKKCLKLSQESLGKTTIGQMVNIMSNDVNRFDNTVIFLHYLWVGPLQAIITTTILFFVLGPSCLVGLTFISLFVPLQSISISLLKPKNILKLVFFKIYFEWCSGTSTSVFQTKDGDSKENG